MQPDILARIVASTRERLDASSLDAPDAKDLPPRRGFAKAIADAPSIALIAELKKASPSAGVLREDYAPAAMAQAYERGGATCLSVLTDEPFFQGSLTDLTAAHEATRLPVLRKDFILDERQITEAALAGADAVLLIAAVLSDAALEDCLKAARRLKLDALVEVHTAGEMARAAELKCTLIGVNNRDLQHFTTNLETSFTLAPLAPPNAVLVSESGIATPAKVQALGGAGYQAILVGEHLLRQDDLAAASAALLKA